MEIILNSGVKINADYLMNCYIDYYYTLNFELEYAKIGEACVSRTQMRITTHALANNFPVCLIIEVWDDNLKGQAYFTEYHPDEESAKKRINELYELYSTRN